MKRARAASLCKILNSSRPSVVSEKQILFPPLPLLSYSTRGFSSSFSRFCSRVPCSERAPLRVQVRRKTERSRGGTERGREGSLLSTRPKTSRNEPTREKKMPPPPVSCTPLATPRPLSLRASEADRYRSDSWPEGSPESARLEGAEGAGALSDWRRRARGRGASTRLRRSFPFSRFFHSSPPSSRSRSLKHLSGRVNLLHLHTPWPRRSIKRAKRRERGKASTLRKKTESTKRNEKNGLARPLARQALRRHRPLVLRRGQEAARGDGGDHDGAQDVGRGPVRAKGTQFFFSFSWLRRLSRLRLLDDASVGGRLNQRRRAKGPAVVAAPLSFHRARGES